MKNKIIEYKDRAEIIVNSKTYGEFIAKIDLDDVNKCRSLKWSVHMNKNKNYERAYLASKSGKIMLHRFLMNAEKGKIVDHIDNDPMNNRKSNLRICSHKENAMNSKNRINNTSGHKGVTWHNKANKWMAYIAVNKRDLNLGYYENIEDAKEARELAEEKFFGEYRSQKFK